MQSFEKMKINIDEENLKNTKTVMRMTDNTMPDNTMTDNTMTDNTMTK
jgi:hypothetical protein